MGATSSGAAAPGSAVVRGLLSPLLCLLLALAPAPGRAEVAPADLAAPSAPFVISDIRVQGLQRVSPGTVFGLLPVNVGDRLDEYTGREIIRSLFASGFFSDIAIGRDGSVLVVSLAERPAIDSIELDGNKSIESEALLSGLADSGLAEGEIFRRATLERVELELERQYVSQGRYGASIDAQVEE
ncbi:MAG: POTRA domain-containing protein, partial [Pseudomonadales bacterium]|nr:POTRA domain-containing protein [Pseudomonadales bacterium]